MSVRGLASDGPMPKAYDPSQVEAGWYTYWMDKGLFEARIDPARKPFVIIMPPPNVTGELHIGHALTATLEDIMVRWHRMRGDSTLWLPGVDHAGIATQVVVENRLAAEGLTRQALGRGRFTQRAMEWAQRCRQVIAEQHRRLGVSCDWSRERFTLDEGPSLAVRTTFLHLYEKGLIYRGERIINWCPRCGTALSDLEVEHEMVEGHLYYVRYPLVGGGFIEVATTRPETILGDTAVAVNPEDSRFKPLVGRRAVLPVIGREIPIVADSAVDPAFGTGAVKVTPSHDPVDFEVAQRQSLPAVNILNPDATMNQNAGPYAGLDRFACRRAILADLARDGLLVKEEPHLHAVGHCQRCRTIVEPLLSKQWFVRMAPLAAPAIEAVQDQRVIIIPESFTKVYLNWMENIRDWCISRQLWWGHRIPVWYCQRCDGVTVSLEDPSTCSQCGGKEIFQDADVLDTWFSSALWPHSTLGWPGDHPDFRYFYPTTVMETGYDILFFWVARMIMMGLENTGKVPFRTVYLHGLIRDEKGEKMSKVRGNVLNPLELTQKYGTDALRFSLTMGNSPGNDIRLTLDKLEWGRNFANKLWNASRFVIANLAGSPSPIPLPPREKWTPEDRWIMSRLNYTAARVTRLMDDFQFGEALRQVHDFLWGEFCDWYIEIAKVRLRDPQKVSPLGVLVHGLEASLRLLHPFMPFVTEEIWQRLRPYLAGAPGPDSIMVAPYPVADDAAADPEAEREMETIVEIVRSIRNTRAEFRLEATRWVEAHIYAGERLPFIQPHSEVIQTLARVQPLAIWGEGKEVPSKDGSAVVVLRDAVVALPLAGMVDLEEERKRLKGELEQVEAQVKRLEAKLQDAAFTSRAPSKVVDGERERLQAFRQKAEKLEEQLARLGKL